MCTHTEYKLGGWHMHTFDWGNPQSRWCLIPAKLLPLVFRGRGSKVAPFVTPRYLMLLGPSADGVALYHWDNTQQWCFCLCGVCSGSNIRACVPYTPWLSFENVICVLGRVSSVISRKKCGELFGGEPQKQAELKNTHISEHQRIWLHHSKGGVGDRIQARLIWENYQTHVIF